MRRAENEQKKSVMIAMADRYGMEAANFERTVMQTLMPKTKGPPPTQEQVAAFLLVAFEYKLNPFLKEIYAFPAKGGGIVPMVGFDGWMAIAERHTQMDGMEFRYIDGKEGDFGITAIVHRKDRKFPIEVTEWYMECRRDTDPWRNMQRRMLRNKAAGQAVRIAFGVSGIHDEDEAADIGRFNRRIEAFEAEVSLGVEPKDSAFKGLKPQEITTASTTSHGEVIPEQDELVHADTGEPMDDADLVAEPTADPSADSGQENPFDKDTPWGN